MKIEAAHRLRAASSALGKTPAAISKYFMTKYKGDKSPSNAPKGSSHSDVIVYFKKDVVKAIEAELKTDGWKQQANYGAEGHHWVKDDWKASVKFDVKRKLTFFSILYPNPKFGTGNRNVPLYD